MEKGIFWARRDADGKIELLTVKTPCDENGSALCPVCYTSKSGDNFNHKAEWEKLNRSVTKGRAYNAYPRGRVEIKNGKVTVYANPELLREDIRLFIIQTFRLAQAASQGKVRFCADGSAHYRFFTEEEF